MSERLRQSSYWWPDRADTPRLLVGICARPPEQDHKGQAASTRVRHRRLTSDCSPTWMSLRMSTEDLEHRPSVSPNRHEGMVPPRSSQEPDRSRKWSRLRSKDCRAKIRTPGLALLALEYPSLTLIVTSRCVDHNLFLRSVCFSTGIRPSRRHHVDLVTMILEQSPHRYSAMMSNHFPFDDRGAFKGLPL